MLPGTGLFSYCMCNQKHTPSREWFLWPSYYFEPNVLHLYHALVCSSEGYIDTMHSLVGLGYRIYTSVWLGNNRLVVWVVVPIKITEGQTCNDILGALRTATLIHACGKCSQIITLVVNPSTSTPAANLIGMENLLLKQILNIHDNLLFMLTSTRFLFPSTPTSGPSKPYHALPHWYTWPSTRVSVLGTESSRIPLCANSANFRQHMMPDSAVQKLSTKVVI